MPSLTQTKCYIVDIDGTCADCSHRRHHVESTPKNWEAFHTSCADDKPIEHIRDLLWVVEASTLPLIYIVYVSGRREAEREVTQDWLMRHGFPAGVLYMRATGDFRDDTIVKREILDQMREDGWDPVLAFDDRDRVVAMWREAGIPCLQVAPGNF